MITVILPTVNRPQMLRKALSSIDRQTEKRRITNVIVSENGGNRQSEEICAEFPQIPINYLFRDPPVTAFDHGVSLFEGLDNSSSPYVAILHDDDWWGTNHIFNAFNELEKHPDAVAYWASSYYMHGEASWIMHCWNMTSWVASGFAPMTEIARLDRKQAALACVGSGPAHYSTLLARRKPLLAAADRVAKTANAHDSDRLFFLELARLGPLLLNLVPEVFIRQHPTQDQLSLSFEESNKHIAAATRLVLDFCKQEGIDIIQEFSRLYQECPVPELRRYLFGMFDRRVVAELRRQNALPAELSRQREGKAAWWVEQLSPPVCRAAAARIREIMGRGRAASVSAFQPPGCDPSLILRNP
ncbi:MAG: glycosyltransferase family 2 protein [Pyrinomonadaceae bacterium]|nr:glycosyltransferase family 2 protein [Pyrinomonadaceae bacterium]